MTKDPMGNFEAPQDMRRFAEQSVEQARNAFDGFITAAQKAMSTFEGQTAAAQASAKDIGQKAITFAQHNVAASFEFAQRIARARDMQEVMQLQAEFMKAQMQTLAEQAKDIGQSVTRSAMDAAKPKS